MKYRIVSIGIDHEGRVIHRREEIIDTKTNRIFRDCHGPWDIEDRYEAYWNRLNDFWEYSFPKGKERVKVVLIERVDASTVVGVPRVDRQALFSMVGR